MTGRARQAFVYLVLSHGDPEQALRLLQTLRRASPSSALFMHHDAKAGRLPDDRIRALGVSLVEPRIRVFWGTYSLLESILVAIRQILASGDFQWLVILSGQDYPIRPLAQIEADLLGSPYDAFVRATASDGAGYAYRYEMQYFMLPRWASFRGLPHRVDKLLVAAREAVNARSGWLRIQPRPRGLPTMLGVRSMRHPFTQGLTSYKGSTWMNLSQQAARAVIECGDQRPELLNHYRRTFMPDESYLQTVLFNAQGLRILNDHKRFTAWDPSHLAHPLTLGMQHFDAMRQSGQDFARKFDPAFDAGVLDRIDREILSNGANDVGMGNPAQHPPVNQAHSRS